MIPPNICFHERKTFHPIIETIADENGIRHRVNIECCAGCGRTLERAFFAVPIWEGLKL